jgi:hypothetical protein
LIGTLKLEAEARRELIRNPKTRHDRKKQLLKPAGGRNRLSTPQDVNQCLFTNEDFFPRSRRTIKITERLRPLFRGLFF